MAPYVNGMAGAAAAWKKYDGEVMATFNALPPLTTIPQFVDESFEFVLQAAFVPLTLGGHKAQYANQAARCLFAILSKCKTNINTIKTTLGQSALVQNGTCLVRSFAPRVYRPYLQNEALLAILSGELLVQHKAVTIDLPIAWLACFDNQRCDAASGWLYGYTSECWLTVNLDFPQKGVDLGPNEIRWLVFLYILACYNVYRPDAPGQNATNCMTLQTIYCPDPCDAQFEPLETQVNAPADKIPVSAEGGTFPLVNATGWPYCTLGSQGGWGPWATNGI